MISLNHFAIFASNLSSVLRSIIRVMNDQQVLRKENNFNVKTYYTAMYIAITWGLH